MSFVKLDCFSLQPALVQLISILHNSKGPQGHLQILKSSGGELTVTSSSARLIPILPLENPVLQFIAQAVKSQLERFGDGGLYCGLLSSTLLNHLLSDDAFHPQTCSFISDLSQRVQLLMAKESIIALKVTLDSVLPLLNVVKSIIRSKPSLSSAGSSIDGLPPLLVKMYLTMVETDGRTLLNVSTGCGNPEVLNGVVYKCVDDEQRLLDSNKWDDVPVLIITPMLTDICDPKADTVSNVEEPWNGREHLNKAKRIMENAVNCGVRFIACQRVVHPSLLLSLRRKGILVLHRLGKKHITAIEHISGALPISNLMPFSPCEIQSFKGKIKRISLKTINCEDYLFLNGGENSKVMTLSLFSFTAESASELEIVVYQALRALNWLIEDGAVLPGAGCTESFISTRLGILIQSEKADLCDKYSCSEERLLAIVKWMQKTLLQAVGLNTRNGSCAVDSVYHHAWKSNQLSCLSYDRCCCGLLSADNVLHFRGKWELLSEFSSGLISPTSWSDSAPHSASVHFNAENLPDVILDILSTKVNAFALGIDSCLSIRNVAAVITSATD